MPPGGINRDLLAFVLSLIEPYRPPADETGFTCNSPAVIFAADKVSGYKFHVLGFRDSMTKKMRLLNCKSSFVNRKSYIDDLMTVD